MRSGVPDPARRGGVASVSTADRAPDDARVAMTFVRVATSAVSGRITGINVTEGTLVKKGDVLVDLDKRVPAANFEALVTIFGEFPR